jgi:hypothetical protein
MKLLQGSGMSKTGTISNDWMINSPAPAFGTAAMLRRFQDPARLCSERGKRPNDHQRRKTPNTERRTHQMQKVWREVRKVTAQRTS